MTDLDPNPSPNGSASRLPGADRARAYTERAKSETTDVIADLTPKPSSWERFSTPTDVLSEGVGWVPPAPKEAPGQWLTPVARLVKVLSFGLAKPQPGQEELAHRQYVRAIRQAAWPRSVRIAVANPKGGAGKSPAAVILGGILAHIRGGSVAVWDASDAAGTLAARAEGAAARCISDIAADPDAYALPAMIAMCAATQTSTADVLGSLREREFTAADIAKVSAVLDATYRVSVADTANCPHSSAYEAVIERADILVVPTVVTADSVNKALSLLRRLQDTPTGLAQRAVVAVLHCGAPETPRIGGDLPALFEKAGVGAVVDIPFDAHIAQGTAISLSALSHPSQVAWTRLAATVVANLSVN